MCRARTYDSGLVWMGALVSSNGDPDVPVPTGLPVCTGALVLTSVPDSPELPPAVPLPVVSTGALVSINGDPDVPGVPVDPVLARLGVPVVAGTEGWPLPAADAVPVDGAPPVDWGCAADDVGPRHVLARAGALEANTPVVPSPTRVTASAIDPTATARLIEVRAAPSTGAVREPVVFAAAAGTAGSEPTLDRATSVTSAGTARTAEAAVRTG